MEFYEVFHFLIILEGSMKLVTKNWKFTASITVLSLILQSIFMFLFSYSFKYLLDVITSYSSQNFLLILALIIAVNAVITAFLVAYCTISELSGIATIFSSSRSYSTGKNLSLQDLFSDMKRTWRSELGTGFRPKHYPLFIGLAAAQLVVLYTNRFTLSIAIFLWIIILIYELYLFAVSGLLSVVSVVEEGCQGKEALKIAEKLIKGQRLNGFMLNLFFSLLVLISFLFYWKIFGDKGFLNMMMFFVNLSSLVRILVSMAYTVFYFHCKRHHDEEVEMLGDFQYAELPAAASLGSDTP